MLKTFDKVAYKSLDDFVYGKSLYPVTTKNGIVIGGGTIIPEVNFTLPAMLIEKSTMPEVRNQYKEMITEVLQRAVELQSKSLVVEIEFLPPMTMNPEWGIEICKIVKNAMNEFEAKYGLKSAVRITPNDTREMVRPPKMRHGEIFENMLRTFEGCAQNGADFLAIESTGGKEICDDALVNADIRKVIFALGVMGVRDMRFLWQKISKISLDNGAIPAGDSACGFANTAMVLAERGYIPRVFAAAVRAASVPRALAALEAGAVGPSKDCAYEGVYLKAITGTPIAMEGKSSACAHFTTVGNISAAVADLWSNESVQNVRLLSGNAPVVSTEQLIYDCRLMNQAAKDGNQYALKMRDWLVESDSYLDPQAYILRPDIALEISAEMLKEENAFLRTKRAASLAIEKIQQAYDNGKVQIAEREVKWLDMIQSQIEDIPNDEEEFWNELKGDLDLSTFLPDQYDL